MALGHADEGLGHYEIALKHFTDAEGLSPDSPAPLVALAYLLAACPEEKFRDGARARSLALRACKLTEMKDHACLATFALAHAECGDFREATSLIKQSMTIAEKESEVRKKYGDCLAG